MSKPFALTLDLRFARYEIWPGERIVCTTFPDGKACCGTRAETLENIREAEAQGYTGPLAVWRSLVEHELLHSLVAEIIFNRPSQVLRTEAGGEFAPLWSRFEEETIALALQRHFQAGDFPDPLRLYKVVPLIDAWVREYAPKLAVLWGEEAGE